MYMYGGDNILEFVELYPSYITLLYRSIEYFFMVVCWSMVSMAMGLFI